MTNNKTSVENEDKTSVENEKLSSENISLIAKNDLLISEKDELSNQVLSITGEKDELVKQVVSLTDELEELKQADPDDILSYEKKFYEAEKKLKEIFERYGITINHKKVVKRPKFKTKLEGLQYDYNILIRKSKKPHTKDLALKQMKIIEKEILLLKKFKKKS